MKPVHAVTLAVLAMLANAPLAAQAQDFFAGKTISMSTHSSPGAGYDTYLRLLARHMGKHIPGRPTFVVINQPGAGGLTAVNYAARVAPQDGTFLTLVSQGLLVLEAPAVVACRPRSARSNGSAISASQTTLPSPGSRPTSERLRMRGGAT